MEKQTKPMIQPQRHPQQSSEQPPNPSIDTLTQLVAKRVTTVNYSTPHLPPDVLREYEAISPGAAEHLMRQVDALIAHQTRIETHMVKTDTNMAYFGLAAATFLALIGMATAAYCASIGANAAAVVIGGGDIAALAAIFINGTRIRAKETTEISKDTKP